MILGGRLELMKMERWRGERYMNGYWLLRRGEETAEGVREGVEALR
jgi:hypothetical protein